MAKENVTSDKNRPVEKFFDKGITMTVWQNASRKGDGKWFNYTLDKRYKTESGEYKSTSSYGSRDLPVIVDLIHKCIEWESQQ